MKNTGGILLIFIGLLQASCTFGERPFVRDKPNKASIPLSLVQMPTILRRGEAGHFSIRTEAKNKCLGGIEYRDESGDRAAIDWPEFEADGNGICAWVWTVPQQTSDGAAWFSVQVSRQLESVTMLPAAFCIERCPPGFLVPRPTDASPLAPTVPKP